MKPLDLSQVQTDTVRRRPYRLGIDQLGTTPRPLAPLQDFYRALPRVGNAAELLEAAELMAQTALDRLPTIWMVDRRLIDAGVSPVLIYLMQRGLVGALVINGEAALRDYELAFHGCADEDLEAGLADGRLGLARETGEGINAILNEGVRRGYSIGECLGRGILDRQPRHFQSSLLATAAARAVPTTVHLCMGAEGFQRYPGADGALLGKGSLKDAHMLGSYLSNMPAKSLLVATHGDPTLTQVFLHAFALGRNLVETLAGPNLVLVGEGDANLEKLPAGNASGLTGGVGTGTAGRQVRRLEGPLELTLPLLTGALFSLVE